MKIAKKQIVFLEPWPEIMIYKMAKLLKESGYETISIRILENKGVPDSFFREAFDKIISFELSAYKINLKNLSLIVKLLLEKISSLLKATKEILKLSPCLIIGRATPNWPCALTKILFKKIPFIYFPYDIRAIGWESKEIAKKHGTKEFELKAERFCFENCDGLIHKGHPDELKYIKEELLGENLKIVPKRLNFNPYCSREFIVPLNKNKLSKKDKEIHMVYIGSMGTVGFGEENYILKYISKIIESGMHVHVYTKSNTLPSKEIMKITSNDFSNFLNSKYFHLHEPLGPKEIVKEISQYDYGLLLVSVPLPKEHPERLGGYGMGNKNASYLEAGIPCIYDDGLIFIGQLMKKYRVGFPLGDINKIYDLKNKLKKINYEAIEKNIILARQDFLMEKHLDRFIEFILKMAEKN